MNISLKVDAGKMGRCKYVSNSDKSQTGDDDDKIGSVKPQCLPKMVQGGEVSEKATGSSPKSGAQRLDERCHNT